MDFNPVETVRAYLGAGCLLMACYHAERLSKSSDKREQLREIDKMFVWEKRAIKVGDDGIRAIIRHNAEEYISNHPQ